MLVTKFTHIVYEDGFYSNNNNSSYDDASNNLLNIKLCIVKYPLNYKSKSK